MCLSISKVGLLHCCKSGSRKKKIKNRMTNSVVPDKTACYELSPGFNLFAKVSVLVCREERVNVNLCPAK